MIATITAALMSLYAAATAHAESIVRRIHDATLGLVLLDRQMVSGMAYTVVPEIMYREYKALYLELRTLGESPGRGGGGVRGAPAIAAAANGHLGSARRLAPPVDTTEKGHAGRVTLPAAVVTKADLRAAVKTILRGEDMNAAKPGPRLTPTKRRQIDAAKDYLATHRGCTLHNACLRSFVRAKGGYKSAAAMYECLRRQT